jgi:hypothetical protein
MKRTTLYLPPELEVRLKMEALRRKQPMAEFVREAVEAYLSSDPVDGPPGAGAFASGRPDTADRAEELLAATSFGADPEPAPSPPRVRAATAPRPRAAPARSRRRA